MLARLRLPMRPRLRPRLVWGGSSCAPVCHEQVRRIRPPPPATQEDFLSSIATGHLLEMLYEDGWWTAIVDDITVDRAGSRRFVLQTLPYGQVHSMSGSELRPCSLWLWRSDRWEQTVTPAALETHQQMLVEDERQRRSDPAKRDKKKAQQESRRQAKP